MKKHPYSATVLINAHHDMSWLEKTLWSYSCQTYKDFEIIIVNDGSDDSSLDILNEYLSRIKIITKENGGTASALNIGIKNMTGEWFKWLSADDVLYPNAIKELIFEAKKLNFCAII